MLPETYKNLPRALTLIRELRGLNQAQVASRAGIGKSQMSRYEGGKELPRLDTLVTVLAALRVGIFEFWYIVHLIDSGEAQIDSNAGILFTLPPLLLNGAGLMSTETDAAFKRLIEDVMKVYHQMNAERLRDLSRKHSS
jgi:transcriptional regulator with XRE-family HTH domain